MTGGAAHSAKPKIRKWSKMKLTIVAAPTSVIFDQALPIVSSLKNRYPSLEILCLYPNPGSVIGARPGWTPIKKLEELGATSSYPITPSFWMQSNRLTIRGKFAKKVAKASRLTFADLYPMGRLPRAFVSLCILILAFVSQARLPRKISDITNGSTCVIWDATEVSKAYMEELLFLFDDTPSYSIKHGIATPSDPERADQYWKIPERFNIDKVTIFAMSFGDFSEFHEKMGVSKEKISATGIYRHHPDWIANVTSEENFEEEHLTRDTILVISRGYSSDNRYLPRERMIGYLRDIKTVADKLGVHVTVKPHPKETDLSVHEEVFGSATKGMTWDISDLHLAILSKRAIFAVSFFSGSCLDLTAYGVPTIERLNLIGLPEYDTPSATRDSTGAPVLEFRRHNHVVGSSTSDEFFSRVAEVMRDKPRVMRSLEKAYSDQFISPPVSPGELAKRISISCFVSQEGKGKATR